MPPSLDHTCSGLHPSAGRRAIIGASGSRSVRLSGTLDARYLGSWPLSMIEAGASLSTVGVDGPTASSARIGLSETKTGAVHVPHYPHWGVVQIRVTRETRNPLASAALAISGVT